MNETAMWILLISVILGFVGLQAVVMRNRKEREASEKLEKSESWALEEGFSTKDVFKWIKHHKVGREKVNLMPTYATEFKLYEELVSLREDVSALEEKNKILANKIEVLDEEIVILKDKEDNGFF